MPSAALVLLCASLAPLHGFAAALFERSRIGAVNPQPCARPAHRLAFVAAEQDRCYKIECVPGFTSREIAPQTRTGAALVYRHAATGLAGNTADSPFCTLTDSAR